MLLSAVSVLVVAQSSSEIPEGLMNNAVYISFAYNKNARNRKGGGHCSKYTGLPNSS